MTLSPIVLLNALANSVLAISAIHLWLKIFGHEDSAIYRHKYAAHLCKIATAVTICGSVANILAHQEPPVTEFILNIGVACNYVWLSWFSALAEPSSTLLDKKLSTKKPKRSIKKL